jgi:hypothetical protein
MRRVALGLIVWRFACTIVHAAPQTYTISVENGKLAGPGAAVLRAELPTAQFILFGEDHGFADSPILLHALAREAAPLGFRYLAVEVGPLTTAVVRNTLSQQGINGLHRLVHEVPLGIPFLSLKDDAELAGDYLGHDAKGTPFLWGIDQEFIGSPPFHLKRLVQLAPSKLARALAQRLLDEETAAAANADQQHFLLVRYHDADFDALAAQFRGVTEAQRIIGELKESAAVYQLWMGGRNYENNARRARLLAKNFLADYRAAAMRNPKVIFKMGIEHVGLGTTPINTVDVGTLATEIARTNDKSTLRVAFLPAGGQHLTFKPQAGNPATLEPYKAEEATDLFAAIGLDTT